MPFCPHRDPFQLRSFLFKSGQGTQRQYHAY